ncbi:hypothetical protein M422DRAFT_239443 [Sphaerobolus stellatus SS14]|nr:hypothetical protein M422DRAFT_239443 [Sphaerobolus stellatus SS14]
MASSAIFVAPSASSSNVSLQKLIDAVSDDIVKAYRAKHFSPSIILAYPDRLSIQNAVSWVNVETFLRFVMDRMQQPVPQTPMNTCVQRSSSPSISDVLEEPRPSKQPRSFSSSSEYRPDSSPLRRITDSCLLEVQSSPSAYGDDCIQSAESPKKRCKQQVTKTEAIVAAGHVRITHQLAVDHVENIDHIPTSWPVPAEGESVAWLVDLTNSSFEYQDKNGKPLSMAAIIKNKCVDSYGGGSAGTKNGASCLLLDGIQTQMAYHTCCGSYSCDRGDESHYDNYRRFEDEPEVFRKQHTQNNEYNAAEHASTVGLAVV